MKYLIILFLGIALWAISFSKEPCKCIGIVKDEKGVALIGAIIKSKGTKAIFSSDWLGKFSLTIRNPIDTLIAEHIGFETIRIPVKCSDSSVVIVMKEKKSSSQISKPHHETLVLPTVEEPKLRLTEEGIKKEPTLSCVTFASSGSRGAPKGRGAESSMIYTDGVKMGSGISKRLEEFSTASDGESKESDFNSVSSFNKNFQAGTLTAGEINDFAKWKLWEHLTEKEFSTFSNQWKQYAKERYVVSVQNQSGFPVADAEVLLINNENETVWKARTDNTGKAELWAGFDTGLKKRENFSAIIYAGGNAYTMKNLKSFEKGINRVVVDKTCEAIPVADIVFAVDATSSMGDEIDFLKEELQDIILRAGAAKKNFTLRTGIVMYKDHGDDYVVKHKSFTTNAREAAHYIRQQNAGGGGDFPEAVDEALNEALHKLNWSSSAVARLLFLVLDAPPHDEEQVIKRVQKATREAAAKGIRIIPVTCSGINKSTEFLMRSMALATNGTYVFLTDHSGVGNKHLPPSTDKYDVEKLNDLIVRLIQQFTYFPSCNMAIATVDSLLQIPLVQNQKINDTAATQNNSYDPYAEKIFFDNVRFFP
ncbi:MAG: VWA domain-containing protein, partial [Chitinophagales bacterium]|nr:VWA domain-containing protein [Chitinophagales bacterium]